MPDERSLAKKMKLHPFTQLGINGDPLGPVLVERLKIEGVTWPQIAEGQRCGPLAKKWSVAAWPQSWLIDHRGVIRHRDLRGPTLNRAIEALVKAAEADQ